MVLRNMSRHPSMRGGGATARVECFPLHSVLKALGRSVVDFWALDTEGSEADIIEHTDFESVEFGVVSVEVHHDLKAGRRARVEQLMVARGFERIALDHRDALFASRRYFAKRGLPFPSCPPLCPHELGVHFA